MFNKKSILITSLALLVGALVTLVSFNSTEGSSQVATQEDVQAHLDNDYLASHNAKCGESEKSESKCGEGKKEESKCGEGESKESKCGEGESKESKCGEGESKESKCGGSEKSESKCGG